MKSTIAIDFGTGRTKLAYRNARGEARLLRFEREEFAPSVFYLPRGSDSLLWGDDAAVRVDEDPAGVIEVLKRKLRDPRIRANGRSEPPLRLLTHMLTDLRARTAEIAAFSGTPATAVTLTMPAIYGPIEDKLLRAAAAAAGFTQVDVVQEPVAAARAWLAETGERADEVVVFDAGGGTLDWAFLRRHGDDFRVVADCPPGGDARVGGFDVDNELLEIVRERLAADGGPVEVLDERPAHWRGELRRIKERFGRDGGVPPLRIDGRTVSLSEAEIRQAIELRFIEQACIGLGDYLKKVGEHTRGQLPPVLLVGGSARTAGLREALEHRLTCRTHRWDQSDYATVLGGLIKVASAVPPPHPKPEPQPKPVPQPKNGVYIGADPRDLPDLAVFKDADAFWCPEMVVIPAGSFLMGSPAHERGRYPDEGPQHEVKIARFALSRYASTVAEFDRFCASVHSDRARDKMAAERMPVVDVTWNDAKNYVDWLSNEIGKIYRLPSEAEWEYACRAGTNTAYSFGHMITASQVNFSSTAPVPVGSRPANSWNLYEMHGNVWEWVQDAPHEYPGPPNGMAVVDAEIEAAIIRGGSWYSEARDCRSATRGGEIRFTSVEGCGFRVARTI